MNHPVRILVQALAGFAIGLCLVGLASATALVLAFATSSRVAIPAVIEVWTSREPNGTTALEFVPEFGGATILVIVFAGLYTFVTVVVGQRRGERG